MGSGWDLSLRRRGGEGKRCDYPIGQNSNDVMREGPILLVGRGRGPVDVDGMR